MPSRGAAKIGLPFRTRPLIATPEMASAATKAPTHDALTSPVTTDWVRSERAGTLGGSLGGAACEHVGAAHGRSAHRLGYVLLRVYAAGGRRRRRARRVC